VPQLDPFEDPPEGPFSICETCNEIVDPADPRIVFAKEVVAAGTMGNPSATVLGLGVWFHDVCFPAGSPYYKRRPKPE
jgi:hypothetical protein